MKTQEIEVTIKAEVPVGNNCIHCDYKEKNWCHFFHVKINICGGAPYKHDQCLAACEMKQQKSVEGGGDKIKIEKSWDSDKAHRPDEVDEVINKINEKYKVFDNKENNANAKNKSRD